MDGRSLALFAVVALAGCNGVTTSNSTPEGTGTAVAQTTTATVKRQDVTGYDFFSGKMVIPDTAQANASSPFDTPVEAVPVTLGKIVEKGQTLVKLTIPGADEATTQAKADLSSAKSSLSTQKAANSGPVDQAKQALADAKTAEQQAKDTVANGGTADVDAATQARVQAEQDLQTAEQQLNQNLQGSKTDVNETAEELAMVRADARKGLVRAPISGTIVALTAKPGMAAKANDTLATIINFAAVRIQGSVPAAMKDQVVPGAHVIIAMNGASSEPVDGRVLNVTVAPPSAGQRSGGYLAEIRFTNPRQIITPAQTIKSIGVRTGQDRNVLVVPANAVIKSNGKSMVKVQKNGNWVDTPVETGLSDDVVTEIKSGLNEGDTVQVPGS
ncbi:MAG TPA: efflux RND transporter periplasmic adaptor subunit [Fimbriimonadaceae bacterium]